MMTFKPKELPVAVRSPKQVSGPRLGLVHLLRCRSEPITHPAWLREQYGEVFKVRVFGIEMHVLSGPDAFEQVFVNRDKSFASGPAWSHFIGPFFHRGLMLLDFEEHLHHRRLMQQAFGVEELKHYHRLQVPHVRRNLADWDRWATTDGHHARQPQLERLFRDLTLDLALEVFVGLDLPKAERTRINRAFIQAIGGGTAIVRRDLPGHVGPWGRGLAARKVLETFFRDALPTKREQGGDDLFAQMCLARDDDGNAFSDDDIVSHMIFLLMAAHDTTTTTMTYMAYQLAKHPQWQQTCREEALALTDPTYEEALAAMPTLDLVMKESLRMCSPVPSIPRVTTRDVEIGGYFVPEGSIVANLPYGNHYLPDIWPDPYRFDPERFAEHRREDKVHRLAFEPFGAGVHKCIGMHFAGMQIRAIFGEILTRFEWSVPDDYEMKVDLTALPVPRDGLPVTLRARG